MVLESHQGMEGIAAKQLLDLKQWQKVQNLFSEIIGTNLWLIEPSSATGLSAPSKVCGFCSDLVSSKKTARANQSECVFKAFQNWVHKKENTYKCPHHLHYFSVPIGWKDQTVGVIVAGPLLVGKREDEGAYRTICEKQDIDPEAFLDRLHEIKIYSHNAIRVMIDFLRELIQYLLRLAHQRVELEQLVPGFLASQKQGEGIFSATYANLLANYLLDIASGVLRADSGSVLLVDERERSFSIRSARGLRPEILKKKPMSLQSGVAGWVVSQRKPLLIGPGVKEGIPKAKLKRPQIKCSIVIPLEFEDKVLGVFCLNAKSENKRFNQNNLLLLNQLGRLASVAFSRASFN